MSCKTHGMPEGLHCYECDIVKLESRIAELTGVLERADGELVHRHNRIAELVTALHNVKRMASSGC